MIKKTDNVNNSDLDGDSVTVISTAISLTSIVLRIESRSKSMTGDLTKLMYALLPLGGAVIVREFIPLAILGSNWE